MGIDVSQHFFKKKIEDNFFILFKAFRKKMEKKLFMWASVDLSLTITFNIYMY